MKQEEEEEGEERGREEGEESGEEEGTEEEEEGEGKETKFGYAVKWRLMTTRLPNGGSGRASPEHSKQSS